MKTLHLTILALLFIAGFLFGVQIPSFVDQYEKRIDAHYLEVNENFKGFQEIANRLHNGSIEALIEKHEASTDTTFRAEAEPLRNIFERKLRFERERQALQTTYVKKVWYVASTGDREIIEETYGSFSANLPLNTHAIASGLAIGFTAAILLQLLISLVKIIFRSIKPGERTVLPH